MIDLRRDHTFVDAREHAGGMSYRYAFSNGYGASVIKGPYSHGGPDGLYELAVLNGGELCYTTPITDDVIGWCTAQVINDLLEKIEALE